MQVVLADVTMQLGQQTVTPEEVASFCESFCETDSQDDLSVSELYFKATLVSCGDDEHTLFFAQITRSTT